MTTITRFTKEQLIARINKQIDINATIIERLGDDSAAVSELAVKTATMDMKILDAALASLTAEPVAYVIQDRYERQNDDPGHLSRSHVTKYVSDDDIQEHEITCTPLYSALPAPDNKQTDELVMWVKRLAHSLRKANPDSKLQSDAMDYLTRKGLIRVDDVLR